jgi:hypothetical protein
VRSGSYLASGVKAPSAAGAFEVVSITPVNSDFVMTGLCSNFLPLKRLVERHPGETFFVTNRACPCGGGRIRNMITVARRTLPAGADPAFDSAWARYRASSDAHRDLHLKYLPRLSRAPWLLAQAVAALGGSRPVIMGKGYLAQAHGVGPNFVEVCVDISSSAVARRIAGLVLGCSASLDVDEAFVIEGKERADLPERVLYQVRLQGVDTEAAAVDLKEGDYIAPPVANDAEQ